MSDPQPTDPTPTPRYEAILQQASEQARDRGHRHVGVEHLLMAVLLEGDSVAAQVLARRTEPGDLVADLEEVLGDAAYGARTPGSA